MTSHHSISEHKVLCAGCSCLDLFLLNCDDLPVRDGLALVGDVQFIPGCSTSNTGKSLAELGINTELLTLIGNDANGDTILRMWKESNIGTQFVKRSSNVTTALSVLPVYQDGKRGIYFCSGANTTVTAEDLLGFDILSGLRILHHNFPFSVFHFGYPTLLPNLQGLPLSSLFQSVLTATSHDDDDVNHHSSFISLDTTSLHDHQKHLSILQPSLPLVAIFKCNIEEAVSIVGRLDLIERVKSSKDSTASVEDVISPEEILEVAQEVLKLGPGMTTISLGINGAFVATSDGKTLRERLSKQLVEELGTSLDSDWANQNVFVPPFKPQGRINATGAGDAFIAGFLAGLLHEPIRKEGLVTVIKVAHATALQRIETEKPPKPLNLTELHELIPRLTVLQPTNVKLQKW